MSTTEAILETLSALPPDKQVQVLDFAQRLGGKPELKPVGQPVSALRSIAELNLDGPPDWSERFHQYLYGENARDGK